VHVHGSADWRQVQGSLLNAQCQTVQFGALASLQVRPTTTTTILVWPCMEAEVLPAHCAPLPPP
jgi:hypothetical protein